MPAPPMSPIGSPPTPHAFGVNVHALVGGARVIDAGVEASGGLAAGHAMVEACMGGLGNMSFVPVSDRRRPVPGRAGLDRSSVDRVHGVAVRGLGRCTSTSTLPWDPVRSAP